MKKLNFIEPPKMDFNPNHKLSMEEMHQVTGGAGCICDKNPFNLGNGCACNMNKFGLCTGVNGGGPGPGNGCVSNLGDITIVKPCYTDR